MSLVIDLLSAYDSNFGFPPTLFAMKSVPSFSAFYFALKSDASGPAYFLDILVPGFEEIGRFFGKMNFIASILATSSELIISLANWTPARAFAI